MHLGRRSIRRREHSSVHISRRSISRKPHVLIFCSEWREQLYIRISSHSHIFNGNDSSEETLLLQLPIFILCIILSYDHSIPFSTSSHPTNTTWFSPGHVYRCISLITTDGASKKVKDNDARLTDAFQEMPAVPHVLPLIYTNVPGNDDPETIKKKWRQTSYERAPVVE